MTSERPVNDISGPPEAPRPPIYNEAKESLKSFSFSLERFYGRIIFRRILRRNLEYLAEIYRRKRSLIIKTQDLKIYLGINDLGSLTYFGRTLSLLAKVGLAEKINNGHRIKRYTLKPKNIWISYFETCRKRRFDCKNCFFKSSCPYVITVRMIEREIYGVKHGN